MRQFYYVGTRRTLSVLMLVVSLATAHAIADMIIDSNVPDISEYGLEPISEFSVDIRVVPNGVAFLPDGSIVLAGDEAVLAGRLGDGKPAIAVCINAQGEELWRYEERYLPGTDNRFFGAYALENGNILIFHSAIDANYSRQVFALQIHDGELMSRTELPEMSSMYGVNSGYVVWTSDRSIITDTNVTHYPRFDMYSQSNEKIWSKAYDHPFYAGRFLPHSDGYYLVGYGDVTETSSPEYSGYAAKMSADGDIEWGHLFINSFSESNSTYSDAVLQNDGGLLAVGVVYEASDGSTPSAPCATSYSPNGEKRWERTYSEWTGFNFDAVAVTKGGYLANIWHSGGFGNAVRQELTMVLLNEEGELIAKSEELLGDGMYKDTVSLHNTNHGAYMIIGVQLADDEELLRADARYYQTIIRQVE
ncbi:MAG: hypothetical protein FWF86_01520 [Clostridia bacterium]|nr:hypothetical protein [Clostridia bacterium]